ncbi:MAG TPA: hypothetical protein VMU50_09785 [Polyangia bacterium]|nr:hypothetical protein [Polyangia bacterium]
MYVDRAEYLVRLADALDVDTMMLIALACGTLTSEQAHRQLSRVGRTDDVSRKRAKGVVVPGAGPPKPEAADITADAAQFAVDPARIEAASRGFVLLISTAGEGRPDLTTVLGRHADLGGLVATNVATGLMLAERYRPELIFLDLGVAGPNAFEACRVLAGLTSRSGRRCRVVAGTSVMTDTIEKPALMAGAANVTLFPFAAGLYQSELDRLEERLGPRKVARR